MSNEERDNSLYKYPNSFVLKNKFDLHDPQELDRAERLAVRVRVEQGVPSGSFDLKHLQAIHKHLFQDVYEWAGELRKTNIAKSHWFMPHDRIEMAMSDVTKRLRAGNYLKDLKTDQFAKQAGIIIGDVNHIHPFREGNGRTQMQYLKQLGNEANHKIDLTRFEKRDWIEASKDANEAKYEKMQECIAASIDKGQDRSPQERSFEAIKKRYQTSLEKEISNAKSEEAQNNSAGRLETAARARTAALAKMGENVVVPTGTPVERDKSKSQDQGQER